MSHTVFRPNDSAVRIANSGAREEMTRVEANMRLQPGDTYLLPWRDRPFQVQHDGSVVQIGKSR